MTTRSAPRRPGRPHGLSFRSRVAALGAAGLVLGQLLAAVPVAAAEPRPVVAPAADPGEVGELQPGVQYEEAMAHAGDRIEFAPGGRVTVGYRPRAGDSWDVAGRAPRALPAGSASGGELRSSGANPAPAPVAPAPSDDAAPPPASDAPVDAPTDDPSAVPQADGASIGLPAADEDVALDGTRLRKQVMGFLPYWEVSDAVLDYELLSTIAYFSVGADKNGNLLKLDPDGTPTTGWGGWTSSRMTSIINAAHTKGTRVVLTLSVFAWTSGQAATQGALLGSPAARLNLAQQAAAAVRARGADGINLDFEPIASGYADEFTAFVRTVRAELDKQAPGYQLTFDTTGFIGNYPIEAATAPGGADAIFIMGYDYRTAGSTYVGSIDPLSGPAYDLEDTINAYAARVSPSKLILGVPWYGRAWSTVSDQVNAKNQSGTKYGSSNTVVLDTALDYSKQYGRRWDSREQATWVAYRRENCSATYGCVTSWRQLYFDDGPAVKARYDMINRRGLRGAGIWALGYDADRIEMRQALAEKFLDDKTAPLAGIKALAPSQSGEAFTVSWKGADESGIRDFDVQVSVHGGPWADWLVKTTATSAAYQGAAGYGFAFRVRARDTHGNVSPWDVSTVYRSHFSLGTGEFGKVVSSVNLRATPNTSGTIVTTVGAGTLVAITGGPVSADGYTWYEVTAPVSEWAPVAGVQRGVWAAFSSSSSTLVQLVAPPNTTHVDAAAAKPAGARFVPIAPTRFVDSRFGQGIGGALPSGAARTTTLAGRLGVPSSAVAVTGTITVVGQSSAGYLSLGPSAATVGQSSVVNAPKGDNRASGFTVKLGSGGSVAALWSGAGGSSAHVIIDVTGYYVGGTSGATFKPLSPARVLDTRIGAGLASPFVSGAPRSFPVAGSGGVPSGATAVTGNVVAVGPGSSGYLTIGPSVSAMPATSSLNVLKGDIRSAAVTVKLDGSGRLGVVWQGSAGSASHVIFDVTGYFVDGSGGAAYHPIDAARVLDSRAANGLSGPFAAKVARTLVATGRGTVPYDALAITGGATVVLPTGSGWLTVGPSTASLTTTSTINVPKGDVRANGLTTRTGSGGTVGLVYEGPSGTSANVILDVTGYFR
ncbi:MAG TPA: glycosyl hydrolase family 18 protein [Candidatus Limnocylindrales bacterium]|nr:glycosyl hydrolase family 18 protein [Candidatus Limnocylindrales bacterium]